MESRVMALKVTNIYNFFFNYSLYWHATFVPRHVFQHRTIITYKLYNTYWNQIQELIKTLSKNALTNNWINVYSLTMNINKKTNRGDTYLNDRNNEISLPMIYESSYCSTSLRGTKETLNTRNYVKQTFWKLLWKAGEGVLLSRRRYVCPPLPYLYLTV